MGKSWDNTGIANDVKMWQEALRILKPGGYLLSFGGTRTYHRMACAIEDAGFEIRDCITWHYGSGFPKSLNIGKAIDKRRGTTGDQSREFAKYIKDKRTELGITQNKADEVVCGGTTNYSWFEGRQAGQRLPRLQEYNKIKELLRLDSTFDKFMGEAEREVIGKEIRPSGRQFAEGRSGFAKGEINITAPATPEAKKWEGYGTALKPATELICMARKPLSEKTIASNVLKHGTGGINIDGCRVGTEDNLGRPIGDGTKDGKLYGKYNAPAGTRYGDELTGRFPANLILEKSYILLLTLKENCDRLKAQVIKQYYENYEVPTMWERVPSISEPDEERAEKVLFKGMLLQSPEKLSTTNVRKETQQEINRTNEKTSSSIKGQGKSDIQGLVLQQGIQTHKLDRVEQKGIRDSNSDDKQGGDSRTQNKNGDEFGETIGESRDSSSQERNKGRQQNRKLRNNKQYQPHKAFPRIKKGEQSLDILTGDVPEAWLRYFRPTGYSIVNPESSAKMLDEQSGVLKSGARKKQTYSEDKNLWNKMGGDDCVASKGGASRFFYCAKASKGERQRGCEELEEGNNHCTIKPISLMRYLCRLVTPKGGIVLDPFLGSGTTGIGAIMEGFGFVGIEKEKDYIKIAEARMSHWNKKKEEETRQEVLL